MEKPPEADFDRFVVRSKDEPDLVIVAAAAEFVYYVDLPFTEMPENIVHVYDLLLSTTPKEMFNWYATETMTEFKPATNRSFGILPTRVRRATTGKHLTSVRLKGSRTPGDAAQNLIHFLWQERASSSFEDAANFIRFVLPADKLQQAPDRLLDIVSEIADHVPFVSGHAGFVLERSPYAEEESMRAAFRIAMRHPGMEIDNAFDYADGVRRDAIKGVGWLTMLSGSLIGRLGGLPAIRASLATEVELIEAAHGVILKAGERPLVGDVNRKEDLRAYRAVYSIVKPLQAEVLDRWGGFGLGRPDEEELTDQWLRRFEDGD